MIIFTPTVAKRLGCSGQTVLNFVKNGHLTDLYADKGPKHKKAFDSEQVKQLKEKIKEGKVDFNRKLSKGVSKYWATTNGHSTTPVTKQEVVTPEGISTRLARMDKKINMIAEVLIKFDKHLEYLVKVWS